MGYYICMHLLHNQCSAPCNFLFQLLPAHAPYQEYTEIFIATRYDVKIWQLKLLQAASANSFCNSYHKIKKIMHLICLFKHSRSNNKKYYLNACNKYNDIINILWNPKLHRKIRLTLKKFYMLYIRDKSALLRLYGPDTTKITRNRIGDNLQ